MAHRYSPQVLAAACIGGTLMLGGCGGGSPGATTVSASAAPSAAAVTTATTTTDASAQVDMSSVATSAGLAFEADTDTFASFTAPGGQTITVLIKGPADVTSQTPCPGAQCYVMRAINPGETPDSYFPAAVQAAVAAGAHKLVIPQGTYNFQGPIVDADSTNASTCNEQHYWNCAPHWTIGTYPSGSVATPSIADLDIDLGGSVLNFAAPTTGIWILNAARVRLENFTVDWPSLHIASLGTIEPDPTNPGHQALVLDATYPIVDALTGAPVRIEAVDPWDDSTVPGISPGRFDLSATNADETYFIFDGAPQPTYIGKTAAGAQTFSCAACKFVNSASDPTCSMFDGCANFDVFAAGTRVVVRHYTYNGFALLVNWSDDIDIERANILTGPGMGVGLKYEGGHRGFRFADSSITRASGRLISTASDAINITQLAGDVLIDGNEIGYQGDDGTNISPSTQSILSIVAGGFSMNAACEPDARDAVVDGDTLAFFGSTSAYMGNAGAGAVTGSPCATSTLLTVPLECAAANCAGFVAALTSADGFLDLTEQPVARYAVRNNYFHENRGHGTLAGAPFGEITGNTYYRNSMGSTVLGTLGDLATGNVVVSGNVTN